VCSRWQVPSPGQIARPAERNTACRRLSATLQEWPKHLAQGLVYGESTMANLVMDIVLFFCTSTFVTAVVLAAAMLLI